MDKKTLNNEIILCRGAVRKARVILIRKILKKMKILKSCKNEALKEKKLRKAERLFNRIQIMKKLKDDEVTKFALRHENLDEFLNETSFNLKHKALASLGKHEAVVKKTNAIKEQIPDWKRYLPVLLDSLGKKKRKKIKKEKRSEETKNKTNTPALEKSKKTEEKKRFIKKNTQNVLNLNKESNEDNAKFDERSSDDIDGDNESDCSVVPEQPQLKEEKIDDPFFIEKKVIAPKLLRFDPTEKPKDKNRRQFQRRDIGNPIFNAKPFKAKDSRKVASQMKRPEPEALEELHPSWAAKKVKLIQPFEGKKIKFSEE